MYLDIKVQKIGELKIAYYDQDSMKLNFEYYKEQDAIVTKKQLAFQRKRNQKMRIIMINHQLIRK